MVFNTFENNFWIEKLSFLTWFATILHLCIEIFCHKLCDSYVLSLLHPCVIEQRKGNVILFCMLGCADRKVVGSKKAKIDENEAFWIFLKFIRAQCTTLCPKVHFFCAFTPERSQDKFWDLIFWRCVEVNNHCWSFWQNKKMKSSNFCYACKHFHTKRCVYVTASKKRKIFGKYQELIMETFAVKIHWKKCLVDNKHFRIFHVFLSRFYSACSSTRLICLYNRERMLVSCKKSLFWIFS